MKKFVKIFILFVILSIFVVPYSFGYSSNYLKFDVPDGYEVTSDKDDEIITYELSKNDNSGNNIVIVITKLDETISNFEYNDENLDLILDAAFEILNDNSEFDNLNYTIKKRGTSAIGVKPYSCYDVQFNERNSKLSQRQFICITDNYAYTFTLTSTDTKFFYSSEAFTVLNSVEIYDTITTNINYSYIDESNDEKSWFERGIDGALERHNIGWHYYNCICSLCINIKEKR